MHWKFAHQPLERKDSKTDFKINISETTTVSSKQDKHSKLDSGANKLQSHHAGLEEWRDSGGA